MGRGEVRAVPKWPVKATDGWVAYQKARCEPKWQPCDEYPNSQASQTSCLPLCHAPHPTPWRQSRPAEKGRWTKATRTSVFSAAVSASSLSDSATRELIVPSAAVAAVDGSAGMPMSGTSEVMVAGEGAVRKRWGGVGVWLESIRKKRQRERKRKRSACGSGRRDDCSVWKAGKRGRERENKRENESENKSERKRGMGEKESGRRERKRPFRKRARKCLLRWTWRTGDTRTDSG